MKRLLVFHPTIAPYRIGFFNSLNKAFETRICLRLRNLKSQKFDYDKISAQFEFEPVYQQSDKSGDSCSFFWKNLDEFKPDIVLVSELGIGAIAVLMHRFIKRGKYKIVSICDDSYNMVAENNDFTKTHKFARKIVAPQLDGMILVEPKVTEWYQEHYKKGTYFPIIKPDEKARKEYERVLPLSQTIAEKHNLPGKKVFLFVGRLVALKNVENAIRAFAKMNQEENVFVIVGDGPEKDKLIQLSNKLGTNTIFTGRLEGDTLNVWYNIAQIFILPSYQEAFGAVTNEALLAGCKVLVSEKAGSQCLVEKGKNGYTVDPMNIDDIAEKMEKVAKEVDPLQEVVLNDNLMQVSYKQKINELIAYLYDLLKG